MNTCGECGKVISAESPGGYCSQCLLSLGLKHAEMARRRAQDGNGGTASAPAVSLPLSAVTAMAGATLRCFGDYELLEEIARGGMGVVFKARQVSLNRLVALKLISAGALATEELVKRFKAEAEAAASLSHPNIVPIYEIGEHQGQHYFSMGLIEGPDLRQTLARRREAASQGRNPDHLAARDYAPAQAARLVAILARAVHFAHQRGVLHRDIKPGNILLDAEEQPYLTDFGLAKLVQKDSTLTRTNALMGTPAYMAPEQARGEAKEVTTAADVYGLGAVMYEALTGSPPFAGGTSIETIRQVLEEEPRRPSVFNPAIDRDLETICIKCLVKEPGGRYSSAAGLAADLERWLRHEPIMARRAGTLERLRKWIQRRPALAALTAGLVLVCIMGIAGVAWEWHRAERERNRAEGTSRALLENLYAADMGLASQAWQSDRARRAREAGAVAAQEQSDLRGFEWRYLNTTRRVRRRNSFSKRRRRWVGVGRCGGSAFPLITGFMATGAATDGSTSGTLKTADTYERSKRLRDSAMSSIL